MNSSTTYTVILLMEADGRGLAPMCTQKNFAQAALQGNTYGPVRYGHHRSDAANDADMKVYKSRGYVPKEFQATLTFTTDIPSRTERRGTLEKLPPKKPKKA